jgi:PAS domain S-box-containing protein
MDTKPTYGELEQRVKDLERQSVRRRRAERLLSIVYDALNSAVSGVIITDKKGKIRYANPSFLSMFEYEAEKEVIGKNAEELFANREIRRFADVEAIIGRSKGETEEFLVLRRDGVTFHVEVSSSSVNDKIGNIMGRMASFVDITDRKRAEEALKSSEKIMSFAYSISNDLKSLAIGTYGLTKLLQKHYKHHFDERGNSYCAQILNASEQIAALVEKINVYVETKETPLNIKIVKLKEILQMIREEFSTQLNIRRIKWSEPENLPEIHVDRLSILRVLRNLLDNTLKYSGDELSEIDITYEESDDFHILSIRDDGIGIEKENPEEVFGLFKRKETSKGIAGAGLGLAIVKEIAELHGGKVWLEPGLEKGITFHVAIGKSL